MWCRNEEETINWKVFTRSRSQSTFLQKYAKAVFVRSPSMRPAAGLCAWRSLHYIRSLINKDHPTMSKGFFLEIPSKLGCGLADNTLWFHFEPIWGQDRQTILIAINKYKGKLISVKYAAIVFMLVRSFMLGSSDCSCALEAVTIPCMPPLSMLDTTHINHAHCACDAFLLSVLFHSSALMNISSQV